MDVLLTVALHLVTMYHFFIDAVLSAVATAKVSDHYILCLFLRVFLYFLKLKAVSSVFVYRQSFPYDWCSPFSPRKKLC